MRRKPTLVDPATATEPVSMTHALPADPQLVPMAEWAERYRIGAKLVSGGLSVQYEARDLLFGRPVALSLLRGTTEHAVAVLAEQGRALSSVDHPAVVRAHTIHPEADPPFLVTERAPGRSLVDLIPNRVPITRALRMFAQIAAGLDALHRAGIVHGDVKPSTVVVDSHGGAKLVDVALATALERLHPGQIFGTPAYRAPERVPGARTTAGAAALSDVYSFGALIFETLTGKPPFSASSTSDMLRAHASATPPRPSEVAGLTTELDAPLLRALAKSPGARPASCTALVEALTNAASGCDSRGQPLSVVIADDDDDQRKLLKSILRAYLPGATLTVCGTGRAVLDELGTRSPSVAVLDLAMPEPSGLDLVREVRARSPSTVVVIVTGGGSGAERSAARELGVRRFLVKPFEVDELVRAIREAGTHGPS